MESLRALREYGVSLGLQGEHLVHFIEEQQAKEREERAIQREREKEERELAKQKLDHEKEMRKLEIEMLEKSKDQSTHGNVYPTKVPKLPPFDEGSDDMDAYLRRYERYALSQKWDKSIWATH